MRSLTSARTSSTVPKGSVVWTLTPPAKHSRSPQPRFIATGSMPSALNCRACSTSMPISTRPSSAHITEPSVW